LILLAQAPLTLSDDGKTLVCEELDARYAVEDGIPRMKTVGLDTSNLDEHNPEHSSSKNPGQ